MSPELSPRGSALIRCNLSLVRVPSLKLWQNTGFKLMFCNANILFLSHHPFLCNYLWADGPVHCWTLTRPLYCASIAADRYAAWKHTVIAFIGFTLPVCRFLWIKRQHVDTGAISLTQTGSRTLHKSALLLHNLSSGYHHSLQQVDTNR